MSPQSSLDVADRALADPGPLGQLRLCQPGRGAQVVHELREAGHERGSMSRGPTQLRRTHSVVKTVAGRARDVMVRLDSTRDAALPLRPSKHREATR